MKKYIKMLVTSAVVASLLIGCGASKSSSKAVTYKDGKYKAEAAKADNYGWKAFVEVEVKDSKITNVDFDYLNKDNKRKSQDKEYTKNMKPKTGTSPEEFCPQLAKDLMQKQDLDKVSGVSGATHSVNEFKTLAKAALENAQEGNTKEAVVKLK